MCPTLGLSCVCTSFLLFLWLVLLTTWAFYFVIPLSSSPFLLELLLIVFISFICWLLSRLCLSRAFLCSRSTTLDSFITLCPILAFHSPTYFRYLSVTPSAWSQSTVVFFIPIRHSQRYKQNWIKISNLTLLNSAKTPKLKKTQHNRITTLHA